MINWKAYGVSRSDVYGTGRRGKSATEVRNRIIQESGLEDSVLAKELGLKKRTIQKIRLNLEKPKFYTNDGRPVDRFVLDCF